jgi:3-isopropylmalate dehydratase small subunit
MRGRVHKYDRANIDTDVIIPGPYLKIHDHKELAKHALEGIDPKFPEKVSDGDFSFAVVILVVVQVESMHQLLFPALV